MCQGVVTEGRNALDDSILWREHLQYMGVEEELKVEFEAIWLVDMRRVVR